MKSIDADRERVILGIENCLQTDSITECSKTECPFIKCRETCLEWLLRSALSILKEQEPIKPTINVDTWICSKCGHTLESQELIDDKEKAQILVHEQYQYCPECGREIKWE